jgi:sulfur carrier protein ThiS
MMTITVRLLGGLRDRLPAKKSSASSAAITLAEDATPATLIDSLGLPVGATYLVLVNGENIAPSHYASQPLTDGDTVTICPPIQGG